jgi:hypothetical protein
VGAATITEEIHMAQSTLATSADYADALLSLRRAKNWAFLLLLLCLLGQLVIFFLVHYGVVKPYAESQSAAPVDATGVALLRYLVGLTDFAGIVLAAILSLDLLLITLIMVVGRLIGVGRLSSALIWSVVLGVLIFPWQAFLNWQWLSSGFRLPGILFTWYELLEPRLVQPQETFSAVLLWGRFVIWPLVGIIILLVVQARGTRGMRMALGESDVENEILPEATV